MKLANRVAVVTGGSRGIGAAVARKLARDGAAVAILYKSSRDAALTLAADIRRDGGKAAVFQADVADEQSVREAVVQVAAELGPINVLAHIAGIFDAAPVGSISRELFDEQFRRNVRESYRSVRTWIARINAFLQEHITGMSTVQLFRRERRSFEQFNDEGPGHSHDQGLRGVLPLGLEPRTCGLRVRCSAN